MSRRVLTATFLLASATLATAQPGMDDPYAPPPYAPPYAPPPPPPPVVYGPQYSTINGQVVHVGQKRDYLINDGKRINISANPIGWIAGFYGVSLQAAITNNITVRGNIEYFDYDFLGRTTGTELAISAPIYLKRAFSGPFIEPGWVHQETEESPWIWFSDEEPSPVGHTFSGPEMLVGYHWSFDSGFNIAAAVGVMQNMDDSMDTNGDYDKNEPMPTGYLRFGVLL